MFRESNIVDGNFPLNTHVFTQPHTQPQHSEEKGSQMPKPHGLSGLRQLPNHQTPSSLCWGAFALQQAACANTVSAHLFPHWIQSGYSSLIILALFPVILAQTRSPLPAWCFPSTTLRRGAVVGATVFCRPICSLSSASKVRATAVTTPPALPHRDPDPGRRDGTPPSQTSRPALAKQRHPKLRQTESARRSCA